MSQTNHLTRRKGVWYYRRRVPLALVPSLGKISIQFSLGTTDLKEAKKLRAAAEIKWNARFEDAERAPKVNKPKEARSAKAPQTETLAEYKIISLVRDYVERMDAPARQRSLSDPPTSED